MLEAIRDLEIDIESNHLNICVLGRLQDLV
ncbi:MAG: hypothetical protein ACI902_000670 [Psychroserpens sp.]|jgi:hypothetical protein